jgi:hypothetical protein
MISCPTRWARRTNAEAKVEIGIGTKEREERERKMFGATVEEMTIDLVKRVEFEARMGMRRSQASAHDCREVIAFSMLSDVQEIVSMGRREDARQAINVAKWVLGADEAIDVAAKAWERSVTGRSAA